MTTTMAKLPRLAPIAAAAMLLAGECQADWRIQPTVSVTETFTDNVNRQEDARAHSQFVTDLHSGLTLFGKSRRFQVAATGQFHQFAYSRGGMPDTADRSYEYALDGRGELVDELLFVDASASASPQSISAFGEQGSRLYSMGNRAQVKTWRVNPRLEQRFGNAARLSVRYGRDSVSSDRSAFGNSLGSNISASLASGRSFDTVGWGLSYMRQDLSDEVSGETSSESASSNVRYALNKRLWLTARVGYDRYDYQAMGGRTEGRSWAGGFDWTPSQRTRLNAEIGRHYFGQTGKLLALHRSRHTVWNISYDDFITTSRQQFLLPSTIDTAALLDRLFSTTITDPVLRQQAVTDYIRLTGLPPSLADSINFMSNRYLREKRLQGSMGYTKGRSRAVVSLYRSERTALSDQQSDSGLLGSQLSSLNDNVRQKGATLNYSYRMNSRTSLVGAATFTRSLSLTTGYESSNRELRAGLTRQLGNDLRGAIEVRRASGGRGPNAGDYRENAISATLTVLL
ncbi:TIGR03016 family PEP-CTERM system-associated outer membrane protein [Massilia consociata]|uniref:TIGR03016 family PEP-CTERM system-associated outer membrane protein n=1 Tax=Massilia consociata TaxID=760117 RepID=A0ABV6FBP7_9BURK